MDLKRSLQRAQEAARRGDIDRLEMELAQMRSIPATSTSGTDATLRAVARSVRCHPTFRALPAAEAV
jgi:hypothetical protein